MRLLVFDRSAGGRLGWTVRDALPAAGRAYPECGRRATVADVELRLP